MLHLERSQQVKKKYTIPTVNHGGESLMFWRCVSYQGTGNLVKIDGKINTACYQKILEENLYSSAWKLHTGHIWTFQHDNDRKHTAKSTCHWLQQKKVKPSQSPDRSIIEPLWGDLKLGSSYKTAQEQELEVFCHLRKQDRKSVV